MDPLGLGDVARVPRVAERAHLARDLVAGHGDHAVAAHRHERERGRVVAGEDRHVARAVAADDRDLLDVGACLLDAHHVGMVREAQERVRLNVGAGAAGDVVDHDRQAALVRDGAEVGLQHALVRAVVVRGHDERGVRTQLRGAAGGLDGGAGVVGAGARDDRDPVAGRAAVHGLNGDADAGLALLGGQRGRLAGGANRDQAVDAGEDLPGHQAAVGGLVELAGGGERGHERGEGAAEAGVGVGAVAGDASHLECLQGWWRLAARKGSKGVRWGWARGPGAWRRRSSLAHAGTASAAGVAARRLSTTASKGWRPASRSSAISQRAAARAPSA